MIIVDTGFWCALINAKDRYHDAAANILSNLNQSLITTWPVVTETTHLLRSRLGGFAQLHFVASMSQNQFRILDITRAQIDRMHELMAKYSDLPMDLADASLVILAEKLEHGDILTTDVADFETYRWKRKKKFNNLLIN